MSTRLTYPSDAPCPCGSQQTYQTCCQALHNSKSHAETALQLMRSRFSAFYLQDADYLCRTHAKAARGKNEKEELLASFQQTQWLGLQIIETVEGNKNESEGWVEFVASYCSSMAPALSRARPISELDIGRQAIHQLREKSYFHREEGHWVYVSGTIINTSPPGRNDPCWCGSGKKLKKCHPPA